MGRSPPSFVRAPLALYSISTIASLWPHGRLTVYGVIREGGELLGPSFGRAPLSALCLQH